MPKHVFKAIDLPRIGPECRSETEDDIIAFSCEINELKQCLPKHKRFVKHFEFYRSDSNGPTNGLDIQ